MEYKEVALGSKIKQRAFAIGAGPRTVLLRVKQLQGKKYR